jgi:hypothetical protein
VKVARLAVVLGCIAQILSACGCPEDRAPSGIEMNLPNSLTSATYRVEVCVDSACEDFEFPQQDAAISDDGQLEMESVSADTLRYTSWLQIAPGTHDIEVVVSDETGSIATFDGPVEFQEIDRCHDEDSEAAIELVAA